MRVGRQLSVWALGWSLQAVLGCSATDGQPAHNTPLADVRATRLVELFSWWTAPGEADALNALVDFHQDKYPEVRMFNAAVASGTSARDSLAKRLSAGNPPDLFQMNAHDVRKFNNENPGQLQTLDALFTELDLEKVVYPEVLKDVTIDGHYLAFPVNLHRENALFYNVHLFAEYGLTPPHTVAELLSVCATLKSHGVTPLATSYQGWILRIMFNSIAMGVMGAVHYHEVFAGQRSIDDAQFRTAIATFAEVLDKYINVDASEDGFGWTNAVQAVKTADAAMLFHGDWAKGYFLQLGFKPEVDFGVLGAPGAADLFLYGVDVFAVPRGSVNPGGAIEFLSSTSSAEGQLRFNSLKGSSPIRTDISPDLLDPVARTTALDLRAAKIRMLVQAKPEWDDAFAVFAKQRDQQQLLAAFVNHPPVRH